MIALVHDYLTQRGGAERVVLALLEGLGLSTVHTSVYSPSQTFEEFRNYDVITSQLQRSRMCRRDPRLCAALLPRAMERLALVEHDVALCSTSGWAHGVRANRKIAYCYTPARWLYEPQDYFRDAPQLARLIKPLLRHWRAWDLREAHTVDRYIAISHVVKARIKAAYGLDAEVIPPPVTVDTGKEQAEVVGVHRPFFVTVSRPRAYKNTDALLHAFETLPQIQLVVVGRSLGDQSAAPPNIRFVGRISDSELRWLYAHSSGVISASNEDFGLTPLEGNAFGAPAVVLRAGGFLDTVVEGRTGIFFDVVEPRAIVAAVTEALRRPWSEEELVVHAQGYSQEVFRQRIERTLGEVLDS